VRLPGRTPLIFMEIPPSPNATEESTILMYGHLDKQPPLYDGWLPGLGPYTPVIRDGKLYGRGASDDGYAIFSAITSIKAVREQGQSHGRIVIVIEACEESGSPDLPYYVEHLEKRIGIPSLIICLDSGAGNYEQFWLTTSLRGMLTGDLTVQILREGVHSGAASGVVPSSFRILRQVLSRLEDENTGRILPKDFYCDIPAKRLEQAKLCAGALGHTIYSEFPFVQGAKPVVEDHAELLLNKTWRPQLAITGADGFPNLKQAGNVLRTHSSVKVSLRLPPRLDAKQAGQALKKLFESNPPYGAKVTFNPEKEGSGWDAPELVSWLESSINTASSTYFNKAANFTGEGGSIPFMGMLGHKYPKAQFVVTGVLGPQSNAHGPNEFLHIDFGKRVTCCVATIVHDHFKQFSRRVPI